eukprot:TRINITY_DN5864_c1_g1_i2.p2 TRINITY_DN5864_c1_g1~~TRINITY_DN5864_c1_g1_i2.p2  ORF type:complete len:108 (+),score=4.82 TRINITY_DN5864_c1_g1_i2:252-575(+)
MSFATSGSQMAKLVWEQVGADPALFSPVQHTKCTFQYAGARGSFELYLLPLESVPVQQAEVLRCWMFADPQFAWFEVVASEITFLSLLFGFDDYYERVHSTVAVHWL